MSDVPEVTHGGEGHGPLDALKHRYHGVPGYAIAGGVVVALVIVAKLHKGSAATAGASSVDPRTLVPNGTGLDGGGGGGDSSAMPDASGTLPSTTIPDSGFQTTPIDNGGSAGGASAPETTVTSSPVAPTSSPVPTVTGSGAIDTGTTTTTGQEILESPAVAAGAGVLSAAVSQGHILLSDQLLGSKTPGVMVAV